VHLGSEGGNGLGQMLRFHRKDRELLVTAAVAAGMAGYLPGIALLDGLSKGLNTRHELQIFLIGIGHQQDSSVQ
jgi:hypothetical protein